MAMQALDSVRVLEVAELVAGPYAAKLLADLGADVIKVEPRRGDEARRRGPFPPAAPADYEQSGLFLGLNTNKRSVALDLDEPADRAELEALVAEADIVIHSLSAHRAAQLGFDGATLLALHPKLVVCAVTPFGHLGPHAEWIGEEVSIVHGGGWGYLIPGDDTDPSAPPLTVYGHPASCQGGMVAAFATLGAYRKARITGVGEFIDLSTMAHVSSMLEASFIAWSYMGRVSMRNDGRILTPWHIYECSDGLIFLVTVEADQWERLVEMMGNPEWSQLEVFATVAARAENQDLLNVLISEWTAQHRVEELFHEGQRRRICFAPVFTMADLESQPHLHERGFFHRADHAVAGELSYLGAPFRMTPDPWQLRSTAPLLDEHRGAHFAARAEAIEPAPTVAPADRSSRPLEGLRVVDFSWVWAGPFCTMHLAYLGAEVIKIESAKRPSLARRLPIHPPELEPTLNTCGYFNQWDQGKKSVEVDLSDHAALETVLALVASADVVVDNFATGVMDRLGLSDDVLWATNPNVILASITGFGHTGPLRNYMGYGPTTAPLSGLTSMTGHVAGKPEEAGLSFGDPAAGLTAAFAVMAAVVSRDRGHEPARIDVSLWEATAVNAIDGWMGHTVGAPPVGRIGSRSLTAAPHGIFRCAGEDRWVSLACTSDAQWSRLAELIGASVVDDPRFVNAADRKAHEDELESIVTSYTATRDRWDVTDELQAIGVASYPSLSCADIEINPTLTAREFWERFEHPEVGVRTHSGIPWRTLNQSNGVLRRAPLIGEHTAEVLDSLRIA